MLSERRGDGGNSDKVDDLKDGIGMPTSFTQVTNRRKRVKCFSCSKRGHVSSECTKNKGSGKTSPKEESDRDGKSKSKGWFKEKKKGVSGFQIAMEKGPWLLR